VITSEIPNFHEIDEARKLLGLGQAASLNEIKSAYRRLANQHHPDRHDDTDQGNNEMMKKLNLAFKLLMDFCTSYKYSFEQEDVVKVYPEEEDYRSWYNKWSGSV
jgi:DnaJ-class molecular chaperone